jgi:hypothetical protein
MKEKFLTKEQFERQSFIEWMRTGRYYNTYESYLRYRFPPKTLEKKSLMGVKLEDFVPQKGKIYVQWSSGGCDICSEFADEIFELGDEPGEIHPNCQCSATILDEEGFKTEEKIKLKPWKPKEQENPSNIITSRYGKRTIKLYSEERMHRGVDFAKVPKGTPIVAVKGGIVSESRLSTSFGNKIIIEHSDINGKKIEVKGYVADLFSIEQVSKCPISISYKSYSEVLKSPESKIEVCKTVYFYNNLKVNPSMEERLERTQIKSLVKRGDLIGYVKEEKDIKPYRINYSHPYNLD